jgi:murein DD-endopeptidase MepM/ murein hydrolase activator NlpD
MRNRLPQLVAIATAAIVVSTVPHTTYAILSPDQQRLIRQQIYYYDAAPAANCSGSSTSLPNGNSAQNGKAVFDFLVSKGLKDFQAAGVVGNMVAESGILPQRLEGTAADKITTAEDYVSRGLNGGWGIVQFTPGTKFILAKHPQGQNPMHTVAEANNLGTQIDFIWQQLEGKTSIPEARAGKLLMATTTIEEATTSFQNDYERPYDKVGSLPQRIANAKTALAAYGSGQTTTATAVAVGACDSGGTGENTSRDGFSLPVDQKFYASNPDWFTKPHHDYPSADIPVPSNSKIYAVAAGKVISAPAGGACGNGVIVMGENNVQYLYCHGSDGGAGSNPKVGDMVKAGQMLMNSDNTGRSTGPHLHLGIRVNGKDVCPQPLLKALGDNASTLPKVSSLPSTGCSY